MIEIPNTKLDNTVSKKIFFFDNISYFFLFTPLILLAPYVLFKFFTGCSDTGCVLSIIIAPLVFMFTGVVTAILALLNFNFRKNVENKLFRILFSTMLCIALFAPLVLIILPFLGINLIYWSSYYINNLYNLMLGLF